MSPRHRPEFLPASEESPTSHPSPYAATSAAGPSPYTESPYATSSTSSPNAAESKASPYLSEVRRSRRQAEELAAGADPRRPRRSRRDDARRGDSRRADSRSHRADSRRAESHRADSGRADRADRADSRQAESQRADVVHSGRRSRQPVVDLDDDNATVLELPERPTTRAQARARGPHLAARPRARRRWGRVVVAAAAVTGVVLFLTPAAGHLPFVDKLLAVDDNHAVEPTTSPTESSEPDPVGPWPDTSHLPSPSSSESRAPHGSASTSATPTSTDKTTPRRTGRSPRNGDSPTSRRIVVGGPRMGGWYAGASGDGVPNGAMSQWLGQPVDFAATWADTSDEVQRTIPSLEEEYKDWQGGIDIAIGGTVMESETYSAAASGAYDDRWRAAAKVIAKHRKGKGSTFLRPWHEHNGSWYDNWNVTSSNSADYKKAFARYVGILRQELPEVYISWSPNWGDFTGLPISQWYPGDQYVDCVAPDYYYEGTSSEGTSSAEWNADAGKLDKNGNPFGVETWRKFALAHGKPLCFPEWGLKPDGGGNVDNPDWITSFNTWMNKNANTSTWAIGQPIPSSAAGKVLYSAYFNVRHGGDAGFTIYGSGQNPKASSKYRSLRWGNQRAS